jgi:hypothetical protein
MPIFNAKELIGKTIFITKPINFYRVNDIIQKGDQAKPISNKLKKDYSFVLDSFLTPVEENFKFGFKTAKRSDTYFTFYGNDNGYYAIKYINDGRISLKKLKEQGSKDIEEERKAEEKEKETTADKIENSLKSVGLTLKNLLYIGVAVFAIGYLAPKLKK